MELSKEQLVKLLDEAASGSEEAARQLTEHYGPFLRHAVRRWLHKRMRTQFDSLDFVQDVWASFFARDFDKNAFREPAQLVAFLRLMARNKVVAAFRRGLQSKKSNVNREQSLQEAEETRGFQLVDKRQQPPSRIVSGCEEWEKFLRNQLPAYREILRRYGEGRDVTAISQELNVSERTVQRVLKRVLAQFAPAPERTDGNRPSVTEMPDHGN